MNLETFLAMMILSDEEAYGSQQNELLAQEKTIFVEKRVGIFREFLECVKRH